MSFSRAPQQTLVPPLPVPVRVPREVHIFLSFSFLPFFYSWPKSTRLDSTLLLEVTNAEEESAFADALDKFAEHLDKERMRPDGEGPGGEDPKDWPPVSFTFHRKFPEASAAAASAAAAAAAAAATGVDGEEGKAEAAEDGDPASATAAMASARRIFGTFPGRGERHRAERAEPAGAGHGHGQGGAAGDRRRSRGVPGAGDRGPAGAEVSGGPSDGGGAKSGEAAGAAVVDAAARDDGPVEARRVVPCRFASFVRRYCLPTPRRWVWPSPNQCLLVVSPTFLDSLVRLHYGF